MERSTTYTKNNIVLEITRSDSEFCLVELLKINGKEAFVFDLGVLKDLNPEKAPPCGCGNKVFIPKDISEYTLKQYGLTKKDKEDLKSLLRNTLTVGFCKRCK